MRVAGGRDAVIEKTNEQCKKYTSYQDYFKKLTQRD
jgi:hypothetical protein